MAKISKTDTSGLGLGKGILKETQIGNMSSSTFRPTEAESMILLNISDLTEQGRTVTQQDAINVPEEKLKEKQIDPDNLESAYGQLVKLKMIEQKPDGTLQLSQSAQPVIEELKKAEEQAELTKSDSPGGQDATKTDTGELPPNPAGDQSTIQGQSPMPSMESFAFIKYLDDMAKLMETAKKFVK